MGYTEKMDSISILQTLAKWVIPVLFAITLHEVAHGWAASKLGDPTAKMLGRLTLNPLKHIDPIGTVFLPLVMLFTTGFVFGWAKPVPVTWQNLSRPKRDIALVAAAGPAANFVMAIGWGLLFKIGVLMHSGALQGMGEAGIAINVILIALNVLPIPPLDGSRVVLSFLSGSLAVFYSRLEPFGFIIIVLLILTNILPMLMSPIMGLLYQFMRMLIG
ncbi:MAG: peptidase [Gammaproteobacteria bacterium]|nr:peptidase [Gammaproteobacteria bacterium]